MGKILESYDLKLLEDQVKSHIASGWILFEGVEPYVISGGKMLEPDEICYRQRVVYSHEKGNYYNDYIIVKETNLDIKKAKKNLQERVDFYLKSGWHLQGEYASTFHYGKGLKSTFCTYVQALYLPLHP